MKPSDPRVKFLRAALRAHRDTEEDLIALQNAASSPQTLAKLVETFSAKYADLYAQEKDKAGRQGRVDAAAALLDKVRHLRTQLAAEGYAPFDSAHQALANEIDRWGAAVPDEDGVVAIEAAAIRVREVFAAETQRALGARVEYAEPLGETASPGNASATQASEPIVKQDHTADASSIAAEPYEGDDIITVVRDPANALGKRFTLSADGKVEKHAAVTVSFAFAKQHHVPNVAAMAALLKRVAESPHLAIINARFLNVAVGERFAILSEKEIEKRLGLKGRDAQIGVHEIEVDGVKLKAVARFKENVRASTWQYFDRDIDSHTPAAFASLGFQDWLAEMEKLVPGVTSAAIVRSGSRAHASHATAIRSALATVTPGCRSNTPPTLSACGRH